MQLRLMFAGLLALAVGGPLKAQNSRAERALIRAKDLARRGDVTAARLVLDSADALALTESPEFAEALFVRASLAPNVLDASMDYRKIVADFPASARREESLLRLAQAALIGGDANTSLEYLSTMSQAYTDDSSLVLASYWRARALLELRNLAGACAAIREASARLGVAPMTLRRQIEEQANNCRGALPVTSGTRIIPGTTTRPAAVVRDSSKVKTTPVSRTEAGSRYTVQVAAFATRAGANGLASKLRKSGLQARVDGDKRPFRVRVGLYATYAEAATELRDLKKRKLSGFVTVTYR